MRNKLLLFLNGLAIIFLVSSCDLGPDENLEDQPDIRAAKRAPGVSANDLLSANDFNSVQLEIQYMEGFRPTEEMVDKLGNFLIGLVNKPLGIEVIVQEIGGLDQEKYSVQEIRQIEDENRTAYNVGEKLGVYVLILDGYFDEDTGTEYSLGVTHRNTSVALMGKRIFENSGGFGKPSRGKLESTVMQHEIGHLLGLVDLGTPMVIDHLDEDYPGHCDNEDCLMYWAVQTRIINLREDVIPGLGENCLNDLRANGGK
ncbi:hypothetical protein QWY93_05455 [Echinicola jeungdonensis]|uniref:Membrane metalloprotease n=1 Tax=Echinicola jeungdonensis TaxID=709343 RepID=A0ABV5J4H9_9BACT|nr:hypothetical protein [Echinicola jeungdonensis]MDN3668770.1 hypothetical protein [Echinicola jeungdonensis]